MTGLNLIRAYSKITAYKVCVSTGSYIEFPGVGPSEDLHRVFEKCLKEADSTMYAEKREHKVGRDRIS